jgi:hypothetical protein
MGIIKEGTTVRFLLSAAFITVLAGILLPVQPALSATAEKIELKQLRDLDFGHSLYYFFQREYLPAIINLTVAQEKKTIPHHAGDSELLLAGMYLSFGMHREAGELFNRLINEQVPARIRNRAWFYLAKIRYQRQLYTEAEQAVLKIEGQLPEQIERERQLLMANILLSQQRYTDADKHLSSINDSSIWSTYARYNLAVSLIKQGNAVRGREILKELGGIKAPDKEAQAIRDQANVALGYSFIQEKQSQEAIQYLRKVRLQGHLSNKALLGLGWAYDQQEDYTRALAPWLELNKRNILDSAVQESLLATPYALAKLDKDERSLEYYKNAIEIYAKEIDRIEDTIINISSGSFISNILEKQSSNEMGWFWEMENAPDGAESHYLLGLLASHAFQESLKNYRDLNILRNNLQEWAHNTAVFDTILETRRLAYANRLPELQKNVERIKSNDLHARRDQYEKEIKRILLTDDLLAMASNDEKKYLQKLSQVKTRVNNLSAQRSMDTAEEKYRLLLGVIKWDIASQYGPRVWSLKKELKQLDKALQQNADLSEQLLLAEKRAPQRFEGYGARIDISRQRINELLKLTDQAQQDQQQLLESLAISRLREQQQRIDSYLTHAQFSVAQIQDKAAHPKEDNKP